MSEGEHRLRSRSDFQRFCAGLRTSSPSLDDLVEGLRELAASTLRPLEKGRFAHSIARHLSESFHAAEVRAVASVPWPPEIAMALRSHAPAQGEPISGDPPVAVSPLERPSERGKDVERDALLELSQGRGAPLTVVLMGDEDEHRQSIERLKRSKIQCLREHSAEALSEIFGREVVVGLVVGASFWAHDEPGRSRSARQRLVDVLERSNLCWMKLVRSPVWALIEGEVLELCRNRWLAHPLASRFAIEDQATITESERRCLVWAAEDLGYGERSFDHDHPPSVEQERLIRAATSRYLRENFPALHPQEPRFSVRTLARRDHGLASLVSVVGTDVSFVVKVSPYPAAREEARRFQLFAHGTSFAMDFFCHGSEGALVFAPIGATRLGKARSLEDVLADCELVGRGEQPARTPKIDSAIEALERFSQQVRPDGISAFCEVEFPDTEAKIAKLSPLVVAGETIDLRGIYARGQQVLDRSSRHAVVHGDAHPGNILFSATNTAILIDYECAGLGPACYDLCTLWIFVLASRFIAVGDERAMVGVVQDMLAGMAFEALAAKWSEQLRFAVNYEVVYLATRAIETSVKVMAERGASRVDVYGIVAIVLCRELLNPGLQQFALRCALAATGAVLARDPA
jgi:hypothetical protein